jgi:copper(I)-binding protein
MTQLVRALAFLALWVSGSAAAGPVVVRDAWIRATPPGARTAAAYLTLANDGLADRLLGGTTPAARIVEVHTHVDEGGLTRMVRLPELALPTGGAVRLEPGGLHLMLIDIAAPLAPGTSVLLTLQFATAGALVIEVPVVDARANPPAPRTAH